MNLCGSSVAAIVLLLSSLLLGQEATPDTAMQLERRGKLAEAAAAWKSVTKRNPQDAAAFASLGVVLSKEQKYADAAVAYKKALQLDPKLPVSLNLGLAEFKQGKFQSAIKPFNDALASAPNNIQARTLLGLSYYGAREFKQAVPHLQKAAQADPANAELHQTLAQSCLWAGQYECALEEFQQVVQRDPNSATAHVLVGEALDGMKRTAEAITEFETAAKIAPKEPNVHFGLGYLYWKSQRFDDARREFESELTLDPNHAQALAYLGDVELQQGDREKATVLLHKAITSKAELRMAHLDLSTIYAEQKKYREAVASLKRAIELEPNEPDAHYRIGQIYKTMGNAAKSQQEFAKVRQLHEKHDKAGEDLVQKMSTAPPSLGQSEEKPAN